MAGAIMAAQRAAASNLRFIDSLLRGKTTTHKIPPCRTIRQEGGIRRLVSNAKVALDTGQALFLGFGVAIARAK
jgi:hypothetical protein